MNTYSVDWLIAGLHCSISYVYTVPFSVKKKFQYKVFPYDIAPTPLIRPPSGVKALVYLYNTELWGCNF